MAETETKETSVSKVIANILKVAREQAKQPKPEEVAKVVRRIYPEKTATPDAKQARAGRIIENAKNVVAEAKAQGVHVSTGLHEWIGQNKLPVLDENPAQALRIAKADLAVAIKASDLSEDHWVIQAASRVKNAESAEALSIIALAPKDVRDNPNFVFQTAAQLAGSNLDPETQVITKAFVAELKTLRGVDGFEMSDRALSQTLTEQGLGAMPTPTPPDFDPALFSTLPPDAQIVFRALNSELSGKTGPEKLEILNAFSDQIHSINKRGLNQVQREALSRLVVQKDRMERTIQHKIVPRNAYDKDWFSDNGLPRPKSTSPVFETRFTAQQLKELCIPKDDDGFDGIDRAFERLSDRIFTSRPEVSNPSLTEAYEYDDLERFIRFMYGEDSAEISTYRDRWENDGRRNWVATRVITGSANEKELVESLPGAIASNTLNYETRVKYAPEAIAASEQTIRELAAEQAYKCEQDVKFVHKNTHMKNDKGKYITREEMWKKDQGYFKSV
ncbi:MAG: hypothetical protein NTY06_01450, partial [Candidatus Gottesmanbacteria bacterium]|nr:hypothetical protein [Candidatus Gottesmanbacteria bacterium]